jgi:hypothetical protein
VLYLSGCRAQAIADDLAAGTIGYLRTPRHGRRLDGIAVWAMDNGCFTGAYVGDEQYLAVLARLDAHRPRCLFVTVPDVVGDGPATLARFPTMAGRIRAAGWPVALVGQDGMTPEVIPWDGLDWLFLGGSTAWKLGPDARRLITEAHRRGKRVHVGRVNSGRRFAAFAALGCDTADGTFLAYGPDLLAPRVRAWHRAAAHPVLFDVADKGDRGHTVTGPAAAAGGV